MEFIKQPKPLSLQGEQGQNWKKFKKAMEVYMIASGCADKDKRIQAAVWLHCLGEEAGEILDTLGITETEKSDPVKIIKYLDEHFLPKVNISIERHKFNTRVQGESESFDSFLNDLRKISANCEFGNLKEDMIRDRIVCAVYDKRVKDRLLRETELKLQKAIEICKAAEETTSNINKLLNKTPLGFDKNCSIAAVTKTSHHSNSRVTAGSVVNIVMIRYSVIVTSQESK